MGHISHYVNPGSWFLLDSDSAGVAACLGGFLCSLPVARGRNGNPYSSHLVGLNQRMLTLKAMGHWVSILVAWLSIDARRMDFVWGGNWLPGSQAQLDTW
ncbi:hypothetical protein LIA77_08560 [Sarocladium implicatum]|nr:hypothetical protein LIA77_08560 [Sarocladium implicatum]